MNPMRHASSPRGWLLVLLAGAAVWLAIQAGSPDQDREPRYQGQPLAVWLARFDSSDTATHECALVALRALGPAAVARLTEDLLRPDPLFVRLARPVVARFPRLQLNLDDAERRRIHAAGVLDELGPAARAAVPALLSTITNPTRPVPPQVVQRALLDIGPAAALPLIGAVADGPEVARRFATETLCALVENRGIDENAQRAALAPLVRTLRDRDPDERRLAAGTLARFGARARPAAPSLIAALNDPAPAVRARAAAAVGEIDADPAAAVPPLTRALADPDASVRENAALALGRFGHAAHIAAPDLAAALADPSESVRVNAANALGRIGVANRPVVAALSARLDDPAGLVRASAAAALGKLGLAAADAVPALIRSLADPDPQVCESAAAALGKLGPAATPAVSALIKALRSGSSPVRICAIQALGDIGPPATPAVPALRAARVNDFAGIGRYVTAALEKIQPGKHTRPAPARGW